jgi:hypothetical protein
MRWCSLPAPFSRVDMGHVSPVRGAAAQSPLEIGTRTDQSETSRPPQGTALEVHPAAALALPTFGLRGLRWHGAGR